MDHLGNVLITGCSTGIGRATALHLDRLGFRVFASVRQQSDMAALSAASSGFLTPFLLDVTDAESIRRASAEISRAVGDQGLLGLVNNAGVAFLSPLEFAPLHTVRWLFDVNVFGLLAVTQAFLPLVRQARGRIVNVSSEASILVAPFHGPYSAAKLAVEGFSDALRRELAPLGVQVSALIVGSVNTPIWTKPTGAKEKPVESRRAESRQVYGRRFKKFSEFMAQVGREGIDPQAVADAITHALTAKHARPYYLIGLGNDIRILRVLKTVVPESIQDWFILRALGLQ